jgi:hypothetical protein
MASAMARLTDRAGPYRQARWSTIWRRAAQLLVAVLGGVEQTMLGRFCLLPRGPGDGGDRNRSRGHHKGLLLRAGGQQTRAEMTARYGTAIVRCAWDGRGACRRRVRAQTARDATAQRDEAGREYSRFGRSAQWRMAQ